MNGIMKFHCREGREKGLLFLFILNSLNRKPKSGYELIKEIGEKTEGMWKPSKGTVYPVLNHLEEEKLIRVAEKGMRSKNIFELTKKGNKMLVQIKEHKKESGKKIMHLRNLAVDIFGKEKIEIQGLFFDLKEAVEKIPQGKKAEAEKILRKTIKELKEIE
ncbi:MAG: PadR family transcriptional regulator [archaeon]